MQLFGHSPAPHTPSTPTRASSTTATTSTATPDNAPQSPAPDGAGVLAALDRGHLDELARRLAGPIGRLLRSELRHGRERAGRLTDGGR